MKNNIKKILVAAGILGLASVGSVSAYLTDFDKVSNQFTVGKVDVELKEENWNPEDQKKIEPGKLIHKDPKISNTGMNDAFDYLEVSIPIAEGTAAADNGNRLEKKEQELFLFETKNNWTKLSSQRVENAQVYVYAYDKVLKPQETTEPLFESIKFLNVIEGQLDGQQLEVPVRAYAIQTSYTGGEADTIPEQARNAYQKYVEQNRKQPGAVTKE